MPLTRLTRRVAVAATAALAGGLLVATPTQAASSGLVINEVYARGGSANQPYTHKFVELYNPTSASLSLAGMSVQYRAATSTGPATGVVALAGSVAPGDYFVLRMGSNGSTGAAVPGVDQESSLQPSGTTGTLFLASSVQAVDPAAAGAPVVDKVGYGGSNSPEGTAPAAYPGSNSTPGSIGRTDGVDTDDNAADLAFAETPTPGAANTGSDPDPDPEPEPAQRASIAEVQGTGAATPLAGRRVTVRGVVTAVYPTGGFDGFYVQTPGTGGAAQAPGDASHGLFVHGRTDVAAGDCVDVTGTAKEYFTLTEIEADGLAPVDGCAPVRPVPLGAVPATDADKEPYEGMLLRPEGPWTITNNYQLNQYGQLGLTPGTEALRQATDVVEPGPEALAYEAANQRRYLTLDDGSSWDYVRNATAQASPLPYLSQATPMRTASQVEFTSPVVLDYRFQWNLQPTSQVVGTDQDVILGEDDREASVPEVGGNVQLASFNVLNYFTDLGEDEDGCDFYADRFGTPVTTDFCEVRGAWTRAAFEDQQEKIVSAINGTGAEVVALMEIENSAGISYVDHDRDLSLARLVQALNRAGGHWAYAESPTVTPGSEDVIRTAFIYDPRRIQTLGASEILLDDAFADARYPLAQKFRAVRTGKPFVAIANHFKSKGSGADDGTGQGNANPSRERQARALTAWTGERYADEAVFLLGDFNAYSRETPVQIIEDAGYTNVPAVFEPEATTYQFGGRLGSLDHVFANAPALRLVTGAAVWDINADESIAMQYSRRRYNVVDFHRPTPYASSDHDPVVVGLQTR